MTNIATQFQEAFQHFVEKRGPKTLHEFDAAAAEYQVMIMARVRSTLERSPKIQEKAEIALTNAIASVRKEYIDRVIEPEQVTEISTNDTIKSAADQKPRPAMSGRSLKGALLALCIGLAAGAGGTYAYLKSSEEYVGDRLVYSQADTVAVRETALELRAFVDALEAELQKAERSFKLENPKQFYNVRTLLPERFAKLGPKARFGTNIMIREDGGEYKILIGSPICTLATREGIFQSDPRRPSQFEDICWHMAIWSPGGAAF